MKNVLRKLLKYLTHFIPYGILKLCNKIPSSAHTQINRVYGKIYFPEYLDTYSNCPLPDIYNHEGGKIDLYFIRDSIMNYLYSDGKYFQWDKYNIGLDTHFYTHKSMLETMGNPKIKYGR